MGVDCVICIFVLFNDTATTEIYTYRHTLSLHDARPIWASRSPMAEATAPPTPRSISSKMIVPASRDPASATFSARIKRDSSTPPAIFVRGAKGAPGLVAISNSTRSLDRKSVVKGKSVSVSVDLGSRRIINKKNTEHTERSEDK